jgi:hypothetical protein
MPSSPQTIPQNLVFDQEYVAGDPTNVNARAASRQTIYLTLFTDAGVNPSPIVNLTPRSVVVQTDNNGYWQAYLAQLTGSYWLVETPTRRYRITGAAGQASQTLAA